jgi:shikimate dehydrogenase
MKKWFAVIGDPIEQSMSPAMHDSWFNENNLDATYIPIHVKPESIGEAIESLKRLGCSGLNVTIPHKSTIIPYLDHLEVSAEVMNAVNTVHFLPDGSLLGLNTDGNGFVRSLEESFGNRCKDGKILIIGAGGAARGISHALRSAGYGPIVFTNRTVDKAELLSTALTDATVLSIAEAEESLATFNLIIQTTSVGMNFASQGMPLNPKNISKGTVVADIIYNPFETEFLAEARTRGALTMNGTGMFVHQGALAFEKWTNIRPNTAKMIEKITFNLGGTYVNR